MDVKVEVPAINAILNVTLQMFAVTKTILSLQSVVLAKLTDSDADETLKEAVQDANEELESISAYVIASYGDFELKLPPGVVSARKSDRQDEQEP